MAEDTTATAMTVSTSVVGALLAAGLLGTGGTVSAGGAMPGTATGGPPAPPTPPPVPFPKVGDTALLEPVIAVAKSVQTIPTDKTQFILRRGADFFTYQLDFPPNDESYIPELDRLLAVSFTAGPKPISVTASVEIAKVVGGEDTQGHYEAKLQWLYVYAQI